MKISTSGCLERSYFKDQEEFTVNTALFFLHPTNKGKRQGGRLLQPPAPLPEAYSAERVNRCHLNTLLSRQL